MQDGLLRIADFGSCISVVNAQSPNQVTLSYRPPEIILGSTHYPTSIDMWSAGCICAELCSGKGSPLFEARSDLQLLELIFGFLGTPTGLTWPSMDFLPLAEKININNNNNNNNKFRVYMKGTSDSAVDLLQKLLQYEPSFRYSAAEALNDPYFRKDPLPDPMGSVPALIGISSSPVTCDFD